MAKPANLQNIAIDFRDLATYQFSALQSVASRVVNKLVTEILRKLGASMMHQISNLEGSCSKFVVGAPDFSRKCRTIESGLRNGMRERLYKYIKPENIRTYIKVPYQITTRGPE